ncbi:uncharacterized protein LOC119828590 [Zerene cesonia]|uniref:uncharacterized protein LOC119828590 n=1 Tax=Zerene cesonia TaxID=33412 RepID=UPI0018E52124|nr:uncharacterized protein LOC119828590 [Zerene cesonia]
MFAMSKDLFCVVQFLELPDDQTDGLVCVPYSWVRHKFGSMFVAYPIEDGKETEIRVRRRETAKRNWKTYEVSPLYITLCYDDAEHYISKRLTHLPDKTQTFPTKERKDTKKRIPKYNSKGSFKKPKINPVSRTKKTSHDKSVTSDDESVQNMTYSGEEDELQLADKFTQTDCVNYADKETNTSADLQQPDSRNQTQNKRSIGTSTDLHHSDPQMNVTRNHDMNVTRIDSAYAMSETHISGNLQFPYNPLNPTSNIQGQNYLQQTPFSSGMDGFNIYINGVDVRSTPGINVNITPTRPYFGFNQGHLPYQNYMPQDARFQNVFSRPIFYPPQYPQSYGYNQRSGEQVQRDARNLSHMQTQTYSDQEQIERNGGNNSQQQTYSSQTAEQQDPNNLNTNECSYIDLDTSSV